MMSHPNDLESAYKAASNEQPSNEVDQLIIQAATDALNTVVNENESTEIKDKRNVIKGRFRFGQWQTPFSMAAAALFTVSFLTTYDLWQFNDEDFVEESLQSPLLESKPFDKKISEDEALKPAPTVTLSQEADNTKDQAISPNMITVQAVEKSIDDSDDEIVVTGRRIARKKARRTPKREAINSLNDSEVFSKAVASPSSETKINIKSGNLNLGISQRLALIESDVNNDKVENAKAEIAILLNQHPLSTFSKHQRDRFDNINTKIQLAQNKEQK